MWDATGSTAADRIRLDQRTGDFTAEGNVQLQPAARQGPEEELRNALRRRSAAGQARKMDSRNRNRPIHYEGDVHMWQGANRIQARYGGPRPREAHCWWRTATWSRICGRSRRTKRRKRPRPVLTEVHAAHMVYTEADRLAHYTRRRRR